MIKFLMMNFLSFPYRLFFSKVSVFSFVRDCNIDKKAAVCMGSRVYGCSIGKYSFVGRNTFVYKTIVGAFSSISNNCYIGSLAHPINWVSTSPAFHAGKNVLKKNFSNHTFIPYKQTYIGNDVWIGEGCKIKAGVKIGDGAIIGMGSIVTKDVEPFSIYAGNPAKKIRTRFDDECIEKLGEIQWWNWDDERIAAFSKIFNDSDAFVAQMERED